MADIPTTTPDSITAGVSSSWSRSLDDYPAGDGWSLDYYLVKDGAQLQIDSAADGDTHLIELLPEDTEDWDPGVYRFQAFVSDGTDNHMVDEGQIEILVNFANQSTGHDPRSHAEKMLDAIEATLEGKASKDQLSYSVAGRSITRLSPGELTDWRDYYRIEVNKEKRRDGRLRRSTTIRARFY